MNGVRGWFALEPTVIESVIKRCGWFALEPTVIELVIKRWRAELLGAALQNCVCGWFALEPAFSNLS